MSLDFADLAIAFIVPCLPLLVTAGLLIPVLNRFALAAAAWIPLAGLLLLVGLHGRVIELPWLLLGARVGVDTLSAPLLLLATIAWTFAGWHARRHLQADNQPRFFILWLLTWTGTSCVFITLDAASFYAAYAMMTFSAYGLIVFNGRAKDLRAGRIYIVMAIAGEAMIIAALLLLGADFGNVGLEYGASRIPQLAEARWITWLFLGGFAVKMGIVPLHMWLALAHPQAPVPASAVLSGVIIKAGLLGWLRFLPLGFDGFAAAGLALVAAGLITAFYGAAVSLVQTRAKTVLAYSSISQMGLIGCAIGAALTLPESAAALVLVAVLFALHHGLAKAALFLSVDTAKTHPAIMRVLMWVPAVVIAGAPLTSGAMAKGLFNAALPESWTWLNHALLASSVATTLIMARFLVLAWPTAARGGGGHPLPWMALVIAGLGLPWLIALGLEPETALSLLQPLHLLETLWPLLAGIALVIMAMRWWPAHRVPSLPEGDLVVLFERPDWQQWMPPRRQPPERMPRALPAGWLEASERVLARLAPALFIALTSLVLLFLATIGVG
ncbi:MAG: proton-conducting transporter membrane subunit [Halofilum sp. (in: g-proteobacteria)]|nr:proton-conducting transporter membrane subunit [Halofilum sp. (in: g-proteobacteria)]